MVVVICTECGNEYDLNRGENPSDYQCECGGNLEYPNTKRNHKEPERTNLVIDKTYVDKKISEYNRIIIIGVVLVVVGIVGYIFSGLLIGLVIIGLFILVYGLNKSKSWKKGAKGENLVAKSLNTLPKDYFVFNDVNLPNGRGNIDHVVVGPKGIFAIETKNLSGSFIVEDDIWYYHTGMRTTKSKSQPGKQIKRNAMILSNHLKENGINTSNLWINSIVAFYNPNLSIKKYPKYYKILHPSKIPDFITTRKKGIDQKTLKNAVYLIEPYSIELTLVKDD